MCRVYKGSLRFNTIATAFKKSRENIIPLNNQEHAERVTKPHNIIPTDKRKYKVYKVYNSD